MERPWIAGSIGPPKGLKPGIKPLKSGNENEGMQ
jgi:hypothetical protein